MLKRGIHTPAHLLLDNTVYFITSATYKKRKLLKSSLIKEHLIKTIADCLAEKQWQLNHWVILDNHYHLLVKSHNASDMTKIFRKIHVLSAQFINKQLICENPIWWNYWDYCPRNEQDYLIRLNYLFFNPIKHGYVTNLNDYPFSSFHQFIENQGRELVVHQFKTVKDYKKLDLDEDDF
ncbi:MAG: transposase [Methylococcaceae bacterium]